ncbi:MAG: RNA pseudouridine synthase, partial [Proteobacteria bacterium]|nr:RNA pseudouridine synthase [Pseudomonadota bacterium]
MGFTVRLPPAPISAEIEDELDFDAQPENATELAPLALHMPSEDRGERFDKALARLLPQYSRSRLQLWIEGGHVLMDGRPAKARATVLGDEEVTVHPQPAAEDEAFRPEAMILTIVHEDQAILVLDKPAGLVVHPAAGNWGGTLLNGLLHHCPQLAGVPRAGIVHRLDKDTSGLMVVAKTLEAHTDLVRQLQARSVR